MLVDQAEPLLRKIEELESELRDYYGEILTEKSTQDVQRIFSQIGVIEEILKGLKKLENS